MKKFQFLFYCFALICGMVSTACSDSNNDPEDPTPPPTAPTVSVTAGEATAESLTFTVTSANADEVKWAVVPKNLVESGVFTVTAESVMEGLNSIEANAEVVCTQGNLASETTYLVYAAACKGETYVLSAAVEMTTLVSTSNEDDEPVVEIFPGEPTAESLTFTILSENVDEVKWAVMSKDLVQSGVFTVTAESVMEGLNSIEPNAEVVCTQGNLMSETAYLVYAAARQGDLLILSEPAEMSTTASSGGGNEPVEVEFATASAAYTAGTNADSYLLTMADETGLFSVTLDCLVAPGSAADFPGGEFLFGEMEEPETILAANSSLTLDGENCPLLDGEVMILREGDIYIIEGSLISETEEGEQEVLINYAGPIEIEGGAPALDAEEITVNLKRATVALKVASTGSMASLTMESSDGSFSSKFYVYLPNSCGYLAGGQYLAADTDAGYESYLGVANSTVTYNGVSYKLAQATADYYFGISVDTAYDPASPETSQDQTAISLYLLDSAGEKLFVGSWTGALYGGSNEPDLYDFPADSFSNLTITQQESTYRLKLSGINGDFNFFITPSGELANTTTWTWYEAGKELSTDSFVFIPAAGNSEETYAYFTEGRLGILKISDSEYWFSTDELIADAETILYNFTCNNYWRAVNYAVVTINATKASIARGTTTDAWVLTLSDESGNTAELHFQLNGAQAGSNWLPTHDYYFTDDYSTWSYCDPAASVVTFNGKEYRFREVADYFHLDSQMDNTPQADANSISITNVNSEDGYAKISIYCSNLPFGYEL